METTYYKKVGRKYVPALHNALDGLGPGLWLVEHNDRSKSHLNMDWFCRRVADIKHPIDMVPLVSLLTMRDELASHMRKWMERADRRGISPHELAEECLAWISQHLTSTSPK